MQVSGMLTHQERDAHVVHKAETSCTGKEETTPPVAPTETGDESGHDESHGEQKSDIVLVLPPDDLVSGQVGNVGNTDLASRLDNHPANVSPPETLVSRVRVEFGISVSVMGSMTSRPPFDRALDGTSPGHRQDVLKRDRGVVRSMRPKTMITGSDPETGDEVVDDAVTSQFARFSCMRRSPHLHIAVF